MAPAHSALEGLACRHDENDCCAGPVDLRARSTRIAVLRKEGLRRNIIRWGCGISI